MLKKKVTWLCFGLLVLLQLWAPASMVFEKEAVLKHGRAFKFRTAPVDPNDPFRGKYILLRFNEVSFYYNGEEQWERGQAIYIQVKEDDKGFAKIHTVSSVKPKSYKDYIAAKVDYITSDSTTQIVIEWPFERFYMEESKALPAEQAYQKASMDSNQVTYAIVKVQSGDAVLEDVFINDKPIISYIKK